MSLITDIFTGGIGGIVESVGKLAGDLITTDKERLSAQLEQDALGLKREEAYLADTQSARSMQVAALQQDDLFSKRFIYYFTIFWSGFSMIFISCVSFLVIPDSNQRTVDTVIGFLLGTAIASIFSFFLGTSRSSQNKDATIQTLAANK